MATTAEQRYLRKRRQISKIIMSVKVVYDSWRDEMYTESYPDQTESDKAAEQILSKMGINKPKSLTPNPKQ